jgi:hypothetical protein
VPKLLRKSFDLNSFTCFYFYLLTGQNDNSILVVSNTGSADKRAEKRAIHIGISISAEFGNYA